jgi:glycosyltransferase involved in cell wall biosynthesis
VSIIVPVYNREEKIKRLISTVEKQTFKNWELIIVDDGSVDGTLSVIKEAAFNDPRIVPIKNVNSKGPSGARNTGLERASGKYIAYQDSDDEWIPSHLEIMVSYLEKYSDKIDIMSANALRKTENDGAVFKYDELDIEDIKESILDDAFLLNPNLVFDKQLRDHVLTTQCIVGKSELLKINKWNENLVAAEDNLHNLQVCASKPKIAHIKNFHTVYWIHDDNITNAKGKHSPKKMEPIHKSFVEYWRNIRETFPLTAEQLKYVQLNLASTLAWQLAYNTYEFEGRYLQAFVYYAKAIRIDPLNTKLYKSSLKCLVKQIFLFAKIKIK